MSAALSAIFPVAGICYSVAVSRANATAGYTWTLTIQCLNPQPPYPSILVYTSGLVAAAGTTIALTYPPPFNQGAPLSGTFKLSVGGAWTADIPFDASMAVLESAINAANPAVAVSVKTYNWSPLTGGRWVPARLCGVGWGLSTGM